MAQAYWRNGMNSSATFSLSFRGYPKNRAYYAVAGIESALSHLEFMQFTEQDIAFLRSTSELDPQFIDALSVLRFTGTARAMNEGMLAFADEPVVEVTAPLIEAQIVETALLNSITFQTSALTKAVRIKHAAGDRPVSEFGARRAQGRDAADYAARCSAIAGFAGTSNLGAAARFGISTTGTMAHSFVQSFEDELSAFRAYVTEFPEASTLLVDTYDTLQGVHKAITVAKEMERRSELLRAVRLDSGDLLSLSVQVRRMLDDAALGYVQIVATGGLDEYSISQLVSDGAPIDGFGVGTRFVVSADAPFADSVYKLVSYAGRHAGKLSPGKTTLPGPKQVYRTARGGKFAGDVIATAGEIPPTGSEPLLKVVMENGVREAPQDTIESARTRLASQLEWLPPETTSLTNPTAYPVTLSAELRSLQAQHAARRSGDN